MTIINASIRRLTFQFQTVEIAPPATAQAVAALMARVPGVPHDLLAFLRQHDGVRVGLGDCVVGWLYSAGEILEFYPVCNKGEPGQRFLPVRGDGCGDYDCVVAGDGLAEGAVVFWDHDVYEGPAYLLAGSFTAYFDMWADHLLATYLPDGEKDPRCQVPKLDHWPWLGEAERQHPWPFDEGWLKARDPRAAQLLADPATRRWLLRQDD